MNEPTENVIFNPVIYGLVRIKENVYGNTFEYQDHSKSVFETKVAFDNNIHLGSKNYIY